MKTISQMQDELLAMCKFDGSYPKPVILPMGILALAHNKEQEDELLRQSEVGHMVLFVGVCLIAIGTLAAMGLIMAGLI